MTTGLGTDPTTASPGLELTDHESRGQDPCNPDLSVQTWEAVRAQREPLTSWPLGVDSPQREPIERPQSAR